ncbi:hypothetical protein [Actinocrispum sp. NPDC049592]|uniref:hypothetical protein n=1 Tax=Actinocrispum sp. NPDC049592 TaxID=3154835 RepID=UPI0034468147
MGKELKRGATAQLVYVAPGAEDGIESTLRFLLCCVRRRSIRRDRCLAGRRARRE